VVRRSKLTWVGWTDTPVLAGFLYAGLTMLTSKRWNSGRKRDSSAIRQFGSAAVIIPLLLLVLTIILKLL
jgi:hypothetical protein